MSDFTKEDVIAGAFARHKKAVSIELIDDAMEEPTLEDAIELILLDTIYWEEGDPGMMEKIFEQMEA